MFYHGGELKRGRLVGTPDAWNCTRRILIEEASGIETRFWVYPEDIFSTIEEVEERVSERLSYWTKKQMEVNSAKRMREELLER